MASDQVDDSQLYLQAFDPFKYTISLKLRGKINRIRIIMKSWSNLV